MIKFIIKIGRKYFSDYVAQSNYLTIQTFNRLKITLKQKNIASLLKKEMISFKKKIVRIKRYAEKNMLIKYKKLA